MNKSIGLQLIAYSLLLAGLGTFAHRLAPALGQTMLFTGLAGGGLCLVWGVGALWESNAKRPNPDELLPRGAVPRSPVGQRHDGTGLGH